MKFTMEYEKKHKSLHYVGKFTGYIILSWDIQKVNTWQQTFLKTIRDAKTFQNMDYIIMWDAGGEIYYLYNKFYKWNRYAAQIGN